MNEGRKWSCEYCTYENFPATKRCTLCRALRPPQLINDETVEQDIYKMAPLICQDVDNGNISSGSSTSGVTSSDIGKKWSCHVCTYLNWPRAIKCTQCLTPRLKSPSPTSPTHSFTKPLSINVNISEPSGSRYAARRNSPSSPEATKEHNNDRNKAVAAALIKWCCKACTYENWPRSQKCVICGTARGRFSSGTSAAETASAEDGHIDSPSIQENSAACDNKNTNSSSSSSTSCSSSGSNLTSSISAVTKGAPRSPPAARSAEVIAGASGGASASAPSPTIYQEKNKEERRRLKQIRNRMCESDWLWLNACSGVVEGDAQAVEAFIQSGGDPARHLTADEVAILNRPSAFVPGYTIVHLAIRFQREDMLAVLLTSTDVASKAAKRMPSHVSPDLAAEILREISSSIRQRKGDFPCYFLTECATFALPTDIEDLPRPVQKQLFDELLDRDVQKELEVEEQIINWSHEITERLGSRLYALWNRTAGDCLLDSVLQSTWGIFDRDNTLRRAMSDSLTEGACTFYPRWKEYESVQAQTMQFSLEENQWQQDWAILLSLAGQPGAALEQIHIFAVAHILRRPIIVYGVKFVKNFRGENIGIARFQGVYLPLLWEQSFCWKTPIALGYTRGHFSALVAMEIDTDENVGAGANIDTNEDAQTAYLPLTDSEGKLLPVHFLTASETGKEEAILRDWLDCCVTDGGLLVAQQKFGKQPTQVRQMMDEWLDRYRKIAHVVQSPTRSQCQQTLSSDGETDDE
ncbi:ubiquitin thioesterase ZRANB1 [Lingula anatina]|uniref:ubiquitinyl hydrolase 1 n=1 Tax=Lingula anatina TaxID=7574 RepID=A0A1S3IYR0_LINAN|nr:ubiquitin thioesterase ZRANB1 [Lingula anatina]|eukprot:XP_013403121.1 ubiquitin thioesterase ZRANB1 [Lingula anatina]